MCCRSPRVLPVTSPKSNRTLSAEFYKIMCVLFDYSISWAIIRVLKRELSTDPYTQIQKRFTSPTHSSSSLPSALLSSTPIALSRRLTCPGCDKWSPIVLWVRLPSQPLLDSSVLLCMGELCGSASLLMCHSAFHLTLKIHLGFTLLHDHK